MAKDLEVQAEEGRAINELLALEGWRILKEKILQEVEDERVALKDVEKKDAFTMLVEFVDHQKMMAGLERVFGIIEEILIAKENAEKKIKSEKPSQ